MRIGQTLFQTIAGRLQAKRKLVGVGVGVWVGADLRLGGLEDGIAMIFSPSHLLCTIKSQILGGGGGHGVNGGHVPLGPP